MDTMSEQSALLPIRRIPWKGFIYLVAGLVVLFWWIYTPDGLLGKADAVGYAVCHRIDARSFHIGSLQAPLCARCTGMFLGAMLGIAYLGLVFPRRSGLPSWKALVVFLPLGLAFAVDGVNSYLHLFPFIPGWYNPSNWGRLLTGTGMGFCIAIAISMAFNQTVWSQVDVRGSLDSWRSILGLLALGGILDLLVLSDVSWILYPLAMISAAGVLILLAMIYGMVWIMLFRRENRYQRLREMITPLVGGFIIAMLQIGLLDFIRFMLTHTWDGFRIG